MCGIVGYTGTRDASQVLIAGLHRLEYRGYDSAGLAVIEERGLSVRKKVGRVMELEGELALRPLTGTCGISHTRWATHGPADTRNSHPHLGGIGQVAVVHNGVIENHAVLRRELESQGFSFRSQTDTEVIAHMIARELGDGDDLLGAVQRVLPRLEGTYGLAVVCHRCPGQVVGAKLGSPMVLGLGEGEYLLASDPSAIAPYTARVAYLDEGEVVRITPKGFNIFHRERGEIAPRVDRIRWKPEDDGLNGHAHHMLKEIIEQPETIRDACRGRLRKTEANAALGGLNMTIRQLRRVRRVVLLGCGTSWHAALVGEYLIERLAKLPVEVEFSGEFRYRNAPIDDRTLIIVLSQSGETADTLGALREARRRGHRVLGICNVVGSTIARETDGGVYLHAGPEIGVASTKSFTSQVTVLTLLALQLGRLRHLSHAEGMEIVDAMESAPLAVAEVLSSNDEVLEAADRLVDATSVLYLGRGIHYPVALEGALKLKETSYIHAEGYPAAEMKHGPIALIDRHMHSVFVSPSGPLHSKTLSSIEEIRARHGPVIAVGTQGDDSLASLADVFIPIPDVPEVVQPLVAAVRLQMLAYHVARIRGCPIDKPRNLAKSVTVE